jgi:hypothetical protein
MITSAKLPEVSIEKEMKKSYLDYAMSVIIGRALPDVGHCRMYAMDSNPCIDVFYTRCKSLKTIGIKLIKSLPVLLVMLSVNIIPMAMLPSMIPLFGWPRIFP